MRRYSAVEETAEALASRLEDEAEARLKAMRATGTPVTVESFTAWVQRFEAEEALKRIKVGCCYLKPVLNAPGSSASPYCVIHHILYRCSTHHPPHSVPELTTSSAT